MGSKYYHEWYYPSYRSLGFPGTPVDYRPSDQHPAGPTYLAGPPDPTLMLSTQYAAVWDIRDSLRQTPGTPSMIPSTDPTSPYTSEGGYSFIDAQSVGIYPVQPQPFHRSYMEMAIQTSSPDTATRGEGEKDSQVHNGPTTRKMVPQEIFKPARQQKELRDFRVIEFSVNGEKGVRLSDALEENWGGFESRDDRSLFGDDRLQIMVRLHFVGCLPWQSKIYTKDYTTRRRSITRMKLAYEVAKAVGKFLAREAANGHDGDPPRCIWKDTSLENMYLTRLVRVSTASWQPEIFVESPCTATPPA